MEQWSRSMMITLSVKNKLIFINGSLPEPPSEFINHNSWMRNNQLVISWILNLVSTEISTNIMFTNSAHKLWDDLKIVINRAMDLKSFCESQSKSRLYWFVFH
uniref:Retrotransposon Copia-like N-terminal domain-containing protein n=1 Tax=Lactuca sativa TaxID=4236 RepID=A0A9R1WL56_LACSA|nr:hypothetical protein LSAT_V11C200080370 [Lactuca sativa]